MAKRIHLDLLQYVLDHQQPDINYLNRYFVLEDRLINEYNYKKSDILKSKLALLKSGLLAEATHPAPLYITDAGKKYLHKANQFHLLTMPEKIIHYLQKYSPINMFLRLGGKLW
jgi:hypothetical protein